MDALLKLMIGLPIGALAVVIAVKLSDFGIRKQLNRYSLTAEKDYELEPQPVMAYIDGEPQPIIIKE